MFVCERFAWHATKCIPGTNVERKQCTSAIIPVYSGVYERALILRYIYIYIYLKNTLFCHKYIFFYNYIFCYFIWYLFRYSSSFSFHGMCFFFLFMSCASFRRVGDSCLIRLPAPVKVLYQGTLLGNCTTRMASPWISLVRYWCDVIDAMSVTSLMRCLWYDLIVVIAVLSMIRRLWYNLIVVIAVLSLMRCL